MQKLSVFAALAFISAICQLAYWALGWTLDGSASWAVLNGLLLWLAFALLTGAIRVAGDFDPLYIVLFFLAGGVMWVMLQVTMTSLSVHWGWLFLMAIPHFITGTVSSS